MPITNSFITVSQLKTRITMLQAKPTHRRALLGYALALPLALGLLMCTQQNQDKDADPVWERQQFMAPESLPSGEVYAVVEEQPTFPGGTDTFITYLGEHIKYPAAAARANVEGQVFVRFVITDQGQITRVKVLKGIGFGCDEEAARVVREMPRWIPARQNGKPVNIQYHLPIAFRLEDKE
jgi:TonB family protein